MALNLLKELSREMGLAMAFISHDLSVIRAVCDRVLVLRFGKVVEEGCVPTSSTTLNPITRATYWMPFPCRKSIRTGLIRTLALRPDFYLLSLKDTPR